MLKYFSSSPITQFPNGSTEDYYENNEVFLNQLKSSKIYKELGYKIDPPWIKELALNTQVSIKKSQVNYTHGFVIYDQLRRYLSSADDIVHIVETGTAKGFSSLVMAKALQDSDKLGQIITIDLIPHDRPIYWNTISDIEKGKMTRRTKLSKYKELCEKYILYLCGSSQNILSRIAFNRINFAFLDGKHDYKTVDLEINYISSHQKQGDILMFDDYNVKLFPDLVKRVNELIDTGEYDTEILGSIDERSYVIARKR